MANDKRKHVLAQLVSTTDPAKFQLHLERLQNRSKLKKKIKITRISLDFLQKFNLFTKISVTSLKILL